MKTDFKLSSKIHLFIIITTLLVAIGIAVGVVCQFVSDGYFNYGGDWSSYDSVTVSYKYVDFSGDGEPLDRVRTICEDAFDTAGLSGYTATYGKTNEGGEIVYRFSASSDDAKLETAKTAIESAIKTAMGSDADVSLSSVSVHGDDTLLGGGYSLTMAAIAIASVAAVQFVYFIIRYRLTMAFAALLANVHNLAIYVSLLTICRIPVGTSAFAFGVLCVLLTMIGTAFLFDKMRKIGKDEELSKLSSFEQADKGATQSLKINLLVPAVMVAATVLIFVLMAISAMSVTAILSPVLSALVCFVACAYGTALFTPSVYSRFKLIGDDYRKKHVKAPKKKNKSASDERRGRRAAKSITPETPSEESVPETDGV